MATAALAGRKAFIGYAATSSGSVNEIAEVKSWTVNPTQALIDVSSNDSSGNNEFIPGQFGYTAQFNSVYAAGDAEQVAIRKALINKTKFYISVRPSTATTPLWKGNVYAENFDVAGSFDKEILTSMTVRGTGPITYTT